MCQPAQPPLRLWLAGSAALLLSAPPTVASGSDRPAAPPGPGGVPVGSGQHEVTPVLRSDPHELAQRRGRRRR